MWGPGRLLMVMAAAAVPGFMLGVAATWILVIVHVLSPDDVAPGFLIGSGATMLGYIAGFLVLLRKGQL